VNRLFGTDGVRGVANRDLTPELAFAIGRAGAAVLTRGIDAAKPIVVGRDTRLSGPMLEAAIVAGIASTGRDVVRVGIVPTPGVAYLTTQLGAAAGVMISASHNPVEDNGIKFFGPDGFKLDDATEDAIEAQLDAPDLPRPTHTHVGRITDDASLAGRYERSLIDAGSSLAGFTVVVDAAFGAAYALGAENDGARINVACGATHLEPLAARVRDEAARTDGPVVGVAFDGDADRALFVDERGTMLSGDHVMLVLARALNERNELAGATVVGTVMSNVGLERALARHGIALLRAPVGDRYVLEAMRAGGYRLGGEQSGHIIDLDRNTTGDGPMTAVRLFSIVAARGVSLHELAADLIVYPQVLVNVRVEDKAAYERSATVLASIERAQRQLGSAGRILVRPSGTEPLVRVMIEGDDLAAINTLANDVAETIRVASQAS
jgi:phosphoglucosamine mutase